MHPFSCFRYNLIATRNQNHILTRKCLRNNIMKLTFPNLPLTNNSYLKIFSLFVISLVITTSADAIPTEVQAIKSIADKIIPYLIWLFALGGGAIASVNGWRLFNGQPKAGVYALGGMVTSGLGFNGIFGDTATTLLI